jgi:hypothetical protein
VALPSVEIRAKDGVVILRFSGRVDRQTFIDGRAAIQAEPGWSRKLAHVFDFTSVDDIVLSASDIEALASAPPVFDKDAMQILVTPAGSFEFSLARTFRALSATQRNVYLAETLDEALKLVADRTGGTTT